MTAADALDILLREQNELRHAAQLASDPAVIVDCHARADRLGEVMRWIGELPPPAPVVWTGDQTRTYERIMR